MLKANQVIVDFLEVSEIKGKVEFIRVKIEIIKVLNFTQVKEMNLELKEIEAKVECIDERVDLLTELPSLNNLTLMPPPGLLSQKPNLIESKNQFLQ